MKAHRDAAVNLLSFQPLSILIEERVDRHEEDS